ncbi:LOW QUALITY PROTEIN: breast carcinoma-amplified sequence 1 [Falco naumanni]|uniref:LOW QUALITY PROTEIN: breast carcinoma-amplified sequence 1 n=1 Tax=Falco naumanni TaxID=148594 RepID=UPI001ADE7CA8|nr:LOW QUALITY PROTEIN: breast carcinoma-amplified sequence 1 [Falco naumanni]
MGNTMSIPEEAGDDNMCTVKSYQALSESPENIKNGSVAFAQTCSPATNSEVDAKASVARDNVAVSSPKTMEQSPAPEAGGQSLGSTARRALPFAKSRSVFAFSWSVPGRTEDPATDSSVGSVKLDVSSEAPGVNKAPSESAEVPAAAAREEGTHKNLTQAPPAASLGDIDLAASVTPEGEDAAASKPKQVTFFDRIFKLEKGKERSKTQIDTQEERQTADLPDGRIAAEEAAGLQSASNTVPQGKDIDDCNQKDLRQDSAGVNCLTAEQPEKAEVKQDNVQAAAATDNSVMSFLKTLVSPSKAEAKSDSEDKGSKVEKGHGGQPAPKTSAESQAKGAKKKKAESPKLGHSTFSKLFRHKAAKETQQTTNTKSTEQQPVTSVKSDKNVPSSQEPQTTKQNTKAPEPAAQQQAVASEAPKDVTKEKTSSTPMPLSKLFWKKNASEEAEIVSNEKADASLEAVAPGKEEVKSPEAAEVKPRREESKTPKANLRKFFKLSVKGDGGTTSSEEVNGPSPSHQGWFDLAVFAHVSNSLAHWESFPKSRLQEFIPNSVNENSLDGRISPCQTLNSTERPVAPAESEPVGQKSKESSKDKKSTVELSKQKGSKQETREQPDSREQQAAETDSIQNGGDASKEPSFKKTEKRQSLGGFFKGLGSKRMSDAEVQTDPVSILPAGKSK